MKVENDKFYTKTEIARFCIESVSDIKEYQLIIEPSAGSGNFSKLIENCLSLDIEPEDKSIIKQDYFSFFPPDEEYKKILVIGNPPFGKRNILTKKFIKHSIEIGATTIAFVLPDVFNKFSNQTVFPNNWKLLKYIKLPDNSFLVKGEEYHVPCSFFVWTKDEVECDMRKKELVCPKELEFLPRGSREASFCINGNSGKIRKPNKIKNPKAEHYIKTELDRSFFENIKYNFSSSVNGGNAWIGQQEIIEAVLNYLTNK